MNRNSKTARVIICAISAWYGVAMISWGESTAKRFIAEECAKEAIKELTQQHDERQSDRIKTGVERVAAIWWEENGSPEEFSRFCQKHFIADKKRRSAALKKVDFPELGHPTNPININ